MAYVSQEEKERQKRKNLVIGVVLFFLVVILYYMFVYNSPTNKAIRAINKAVTSCNLAVTTNASSDYANAVTDIGNANSLYSTALAGYKNLVPPPELTAAGTNLNKLSCQFHALNTAASAAVQNFSKEWADMLVDRQNTANQLQAAMTQYLDKKLPVDDGLLKAQATLNGLTAPAPLIFNNGVPAPAPAPATATKTTTNTTTNTPAGSSTNTSTKQSFEVANIQRVKDIHTIMSPTNFRMSTYY